MYKLVGANIISVLFVCLLKSEKREVNGFDTPGQCFVIIVGSEPCVTRIFLCA